MLDVRIARRTTSALISVMCVTLGLGLFPAVGCGSVAGSSHDAAAGAGGGGAGAGGSGGGSSSDAGTGGGGGGSGGSGGADAAPAECPGLIGYWPADGDASDKVGTNSGVLQDGVTFARGEVGDAFSFDGTSSVVVPKAPAVAALGSWTYSFWINVNSYPTSDTTNTWFVDRNSASQPLVSLKPNGTQFQFVIRYDDGSGIGGPMGGTITLGSWTHIALVRVAASQFYLYVDGQNVGSTVDTGASLTPPPFKLGRHFNLANGGFVGLIDELKIYDGALTTAQIQSLAHNAPCP